MMGQQEAGLRMRVRECARPVMYAQRGCLQCIQYL